MSASSQRQSCGDDRHGAVIVDGVEDVVELLGRGGADLDAGVARIGLALAELDLLDGVGAAARQDLVEHLGQEQRIDDVALQLDFLDVGQSRRRRGRS